MMTSGPRVALTGAAIVLPEQVVEGRALLLHGARIAGVVSADGVSGDHTVVDLGGGWLMPGFIDTQVNGGGDVLLNDQPTVQGVAAIAAAHRRYGTTGMLPTLISDHPPVVEAAIAAVEAAILADVPGVLGIHVEGPHLAPAKRGIHDHTRFSTLDEAAVVRLGTPSRGIRLATIAPELAPPGAIQALVARGVIVCAGHSGATYDETVAALSHGLRGFTHLFNAMTPFGSRAPGMVGAALDDRASWSGLIVDGLHVHPASLRVAIAARGVEGVMLVTDAMPPVGGEGDTFTLMGRTIRVIDGTCRGPDGTLAGSALSMVQAVRNAWDWLGRPLTDISRMASGNPAAFLGLADVTGTIRAGLSADLVHLDAARCVTRTWTAGVRNDIGE